MSKRNYSKSITVKASPEESYRALTRGYSGWWTACEGSFEQPGDRIKFTFPPQVSYWTFAARRLEPNSCVELECVGALHKLLDKPGSSETEWLGSTTRWDIEASGEGSVIRFEHDGLTPDLACYEICEEGWDFFFLDSLKSYLDSGVGKPHRMG